ncbi:serine hydroxymethyltransferase [Pseudonocardia zijingensis]
MDVLGADLQQIDPEIADLLDAELGRQESTLDMVASEGFAPLSVMQAQGSVLTNKYAQGYPGKRGYPGCEYVDLVEEAAARRARELFGAEHANVQPHSGVQANAVAMMALLEPGDTILGLDVAHGGHVTHGAPDSFAARYYNPIAYHVREADCLVDMDEVEALARRHRPRLVVAGWSAYTRQLDFARFRAIADECGAYLMVDMAHFAGLVAAGLHPSPVRHADVVTSTTHKTLSGPRGGIVLTTRELAPRIDAALFPGHQGGPLPHVIAAKAVAFTIAATPEFADRQHRTVAGARQIAKKLLASDSAHEASVLTGGTDVHLLLVDLRRSQLDGLHAQRRLLDIGVTSNHRRLPYDPRPRTNSGLRIGTAGLATRGFSVPEFELLAGAIHDALRPELDQQTVGRLRSDVTMLARRHPVYPTLRRDHV